MFILSSFNWRKAYGSFVCPFPRTFSQGKQAIKCCAVCRKCSNRPESELHAAALLGRLRAGFSHCRLHAQLRRRKAHHGNGRQVRRMGKLQWKQSGKTDKQPNWPAVEQTDRTSGAHCVWAIWYWECGWSIPLSCGLWHHVLNILALLPREMPGKWSQ